VSAGALAEASGAFATPRRLDTDDDAGVTVSAALPGRSLFELLDSPRLAPAMSAAGAALAAFHGTEVAEVTLPRHTAADEIAVVTTWLGHCRTFAPDAAEAVAPHLETLRQVMGRGPTTSLALAHRDCYDKQLLDTGDGCPGMVDVDTLALAEPSLDLANVLVHLELRVAQGMLD
jgi:aminoglycoside phosphotransferase